MAKLVIDINYLKRNEDKAIRAMNRWGGGFVKQLAVLYLHADSENRLLLLTTFYDYFKKYIEMEELNGTTHSG